MKSLRTQEYEPGRWNSGIAKALERKRGKIRKTCAAGSAVADWRQIGNRYTSPLASRVISDVVAAMAFLPRKSTSKTSFTIGSSTSNFRARS